MPRSFNPVLTIALLLPILFFSGPNFALAGSLDNLSGASGSGLLFVPSQYENNEFELGNAGKIGFLLAQKDLQTLGLYRGEVDGVVGPETIRSLEVFYCLAGFSGALDFEKRSILSFVARIYSKGQHTVEEAIQLQQSLEPNFGTVVGEERKEKDAETCYN